MGTVFLVDDDAAVLNATSGFLRAAGYETRTYISPREFLDNHDPSIAGCAIFDLSMPELTGLQLQDLLAEAGNARPVIFLSGTGDIRKTVTAMRGGAIDFLTKPVERDELLSAVARAIERDVEIRRNQADLSSINDRLSRLTARQREVLDHVVAGRLNKQIAGDLGTVEKTIKMHRARMMSKMGVRTVAELVRLAERVGICKSSES